MASASRFVDLRLSKEEYAEYKYDNPDADRDPVEKSHFRYKVEVRGYGEEAEWAIKCSTKDGKDFFVINCSELDSVRFIKHRVEHRLRIPEKYWALVGDGLMLPPGRLAYMPVCGGKKRVELLLVPAALLREYESHKRHVWNEPKSPAPANSRLIVYTLLKPKQSASWTPYGKQRALADVHLRKMLKRYSGRPLNPLLGQIREARHIVMRYRMEQTMTSGVVPLVVKCDNYVRPIDVTVLTRIFSPSNPATIDVYWKYHNHNRTRSEAVEFDCTMLYCVRNPVTTASLVIPDVESSKNAPRAGHNGWKLAFKLSMTDANVGPLWREIDQRTWGMQPEDVNQIHSTLFGTGRFARRVSKIDTIRLMLSSVGIIYNIARGPEQSESTDCQEVTEGSRDEGDEDENKKEDEEKENVDDEDIQDPLDLGPVCWDFDQCAQWLGAHIRAACGVPLARDQCFKIDM